MPARTRLEAASNPAGNVLPVATMSRSAAEDALLHLDLTRQRRADQAIRVKF